MGRPKRTWQDTCRADMKEMGVSGSDTHAARALPVIVPSGDNSSPSVPIRTGGPKSSKTSNFIHAHILTTVTRSAKMRPLSEPGYGVVQFILPKRITRSASKTRHLIFTNHFVVRVV